MTRFARIALPLAAAALAATAVAGAAPTATTVMVGKTKLGRVLVTAKGLTLYHLTTEKRGSITCTGGCATIWPPLLLPAGTKPHAGAGISAAKLGTVKRPDGRMQAAYNGLALYRYAPDRKAGDVKGEGVGGVWFAVSPAGAIVKAAAAATTPTPTPTYTSPPPPPGGGYG